MKLPLALVAAAAFACTGWCAAASETPIDVDPQPGGGVLLPPAVTRTINIDGRDITLTISIVKPIPGNIPENFAGVATVANLRLSVSDGAAFPTDVRAIRIRFEKFYGSESRIFFARTSESPQTGFEFSDSRQYSGDLTDRIGGARRVRVTVRLEIAGVVRLVPMGTVPVSFSRVVQ